MRKKIIKKVSKIDPNASLYQIENKSLEILEELWDEMDKKMDTPMKYESKPIIMDKYEFDSVADVKQKIQDLCGSIMESKVDSRSNDAVRVRAAELLGKINGVGVNDKEQTQLIMETLLLFNTYLIKMGVVLTKDYSDSQKKFVEYVFASTNIQHLTYIINNLENGKEKGKKPGRKRS